MNRAFECGQWTDWFPAPAKLNLMLRIIGRRTDGYHDLQTVFQFVDWCDWLSFRQRSDLEIVRLGYIEGIPAEHDLVVGAAKLIASKGRVKRGVDIRLQKNLPMGGGVGGGSSDAATTLCVLNKLWGLELKIGELMEMGRSLGADVPVFIQGKAAWAEGIGDCLTPLVLDEPWYLVVIPDCQVSTKEIFSHPELTRGSLPIKITGFVSVGEGRNDCKSLVVSKYSAVAKAMEALSPYGEARLTGTGACIYAGFSGKEQAEFVLEKLAGDFSCCVVKGLNSSPLLESILV